MKIKVNDWQWDELKEQHRKDQMMIDWLGRHLKQYADAAEFEARVAANLASKTLCRMDICSTEIECKWCRLKMARLRAEEEMDDCK